MSATDIIAVCQKQILIHPNDCSAFVRTVANACGVILRGNANGIVMQLRSSGQALRNGTAAGQAAASGKLVVGGLAAAGNGHVVIVVKGPIVGGHPYAFWGRYHAVRTGSGQNDFVNVGFTQGHGSMRWAFRAPDLASVVYAAFDPIETLLPKAQEGEGLYLPIFSRL